MGKYLHHLMMDPLGLVDQIVRDLLMTVALVLLIILILAVTVLHSKISEGR